MMLRGRQLLFGLVVLSAAPAAAQPPDLPPGALVRYGDVRGRHGFAIGASALAPDGKRLATVSSGGVAVWELATGRRLAYFPLPFTYFRTRVDMAFSPDNRYLGLVEAGGLTRVWDLHTTAVVLDLRRDRNDYADHARFTADGKAFVYWRNAKIYSRDKKNPLTPPLPSPVRSWDHTRGQFIRATQVPGRILALAPDGRTYLGVKLENFLLGWGTKRDLTIRGIVEVTS